MEEQKNGSIALQRITVIDALRGFALLGVILTHVWQHYGIFSLDITPRESLFPAMDESIQSFMRDIIMGKFINIFAFLFGLSFFIQMDRANQKGIDFRKRFLWRMLILFIIGLVGNLFYTGDILSLYALFGAFMVCLYKVKNWILLLVVFLLLIGTPRIITETYNQMTNKEQILSDNQRNEAERAMRFSQIRNDMEKPSFAGTVKTNFTTGMERKINYQFGLFARGYITLALFILGLIVGRLRFLEQVHIHKKRNFVLFAIFTLGIIALNVIINLFPEETVNIRMMLSGENIPITQLITMGLNDIKAVLLSGAIAMGFIILYQIQGIGTCLNAISSYGRMGLTNYEMQNIIGCFLFSMWAFGSFFGNWGATELFILGIGIYSLQVIFSRYWLRYFLYGPLEWLWRSATYIKWQPFKRNKEDININYRSN